MGQHIVFSAAREKQPPSPKSHHSAQTVWDRCTPQPWQGLISPLFYTRCSLPWRSTDALPPFPIHAPSCAYSSSWPTSPAASAPPGVPDIRTQTPAQSLTLASTHPLPKLKYNSSSKCCGNKIPQIQMSALCTCSWLPGMRWWWEPGSTRLLGSGALSSRMAKTCGRKALHFLAKHLRGLFQAYSNHYFKIMKLFNTHQFKSYLFINQKSIRRLVTTCIAAQKHVAYHVVLTVLYVYKWKDENQP